MLRQLTIQLRKRQLVDIYGNPVSYTGPNPLSLSPTIGPIDNPWHDFTDFVEGLQEIELEWTAEKLDDGRPAVGHFAPAKGVTGQLSFEREAYEFIKIWLVQDVAATLNQIEVQITDTNCGRYIGYFIKSDHLEWCEFNSTCVFNLNLRQIEDFTHCIERTVISDNWQGWFQNEPLHGKKHPRFGYCIEKRPNWTLVLLWQLSIILAFVVGLVYTVIYPILLVVWILQTILSGIVVVINFLIGVINTIITAINTIPGISIPLIDPIPAYDPGPAPVTPVEVFLSWSTTMIEAAGCGREHPAPLVRDYILNVCNKCGVLVNATTADTFFAPIISLTHSDGALYTEPNPDYNACYLFPQVKRGIRRFRRINLFTGETTPDTTTYYEPSNAPTDSLAKFLDRLGKLYNSQWRIIVETDSATGLPAPFLYFKRKDWFQNQAPLYDFSIGGADRSKIVGGICYQQGDVSLPASAGYLYIDDAADKCGVEAEGFYNGVQHISFGFTVQNPMFNGMLDRATTFAAARFNCDGVTGNYLYDALQVCHSLVLITAGIALPILAELGNKIERYANYKLLLQTDTTTQPKILIWDGDTDNPSDPNYLNATAVRDQINIAGTVYTIGHTGYPGTVSGIDVPLVNTLYPSEVPDTGGTTFVPASIPSPRPWVDVHEPNTDVIGQSPIFGTPPGVYVVTNLFGATLIPAAAILVNYPMYDEPHYLGTLWDRYGWIDDPVRYPRLNKTWSVKIPLCCEDIEKLNLTENVNGQRLLYTVLLDTAYYNLGVITSIRAVYNPGENEGTGQYLEIKGIV